MYKLGATDMWAIGTAVLLFAVFVVVDRLALYRAMAMDLRKNRPSDKDVVEKFGWVKFPRTLLIAAIWTTYALTLAE